MSDLSSSQTSSSRPRTLVLCFDGTASEYDGDNTNVVKFFSLLKKDNRDEQLCYYQAGVGTYFDPGVVSPVLQWGAMVMDEAFAWYLSAHLMEGYRFIMQNYKPGDKVCMFGFSRGAYTARALAGMLFKVGLLPRDNFEQIPFAYKLYKRTDDEGIALATGFKDTYCSTVTVEFMGLWDTVASIGVIMGKSLPFTNSNTSIKTFRHAVSLDERRTKFRANLFHRPTANGNDTGFTSKRRRRPFSFRKVKKTSIDSQDDSSSEGPSTDVLEVWFSGCHGDVGGGADSNTEPHMLSNIPLRWMIRQVILAQCGVIFRDDALSRLPFDFPLVPLSVPSKANDLDAPQDDNGVADQDNQDAVMPMHDQLLFKGGNILWWILEIMPFHYTWQDANGVWHSTFKPNLGRGRMIEDENPRFHASVQERMRDESLKYKPAAIWKQGNEVYVE